MPDRYYDVVVVGSSLGALTAAALLARRDFTVLVVGQARRSANYGFDQRTLRRRCFTMLAAGSPVWSRIVRELAQTQTWKRRIELIDPMLQVVAPARRFQLPADQRHFAGEIEREFPEDKRALGELYADFARVTVAADAAFEHDAVWPPGTFLERRETGRVASTLPYARAEPHADLLSDLPRDHLYRRVVAASVRFATELAGWPPAFAVARLHGAWTRGVQMLEGGEEELNRMLLERIEHSGGLCLRADRVSGIEVRRGGALGVVLDGGARAIGAGFIVSDLTGEEVAVLTGGEGISKKAQREWPRVSSATGRFVVSLVVRDAGVPAALGREVLLLPRDPGEHVIHLQRTRGDVAGETLLVTELLLSGRDDLAHRHARHTVVERLCRELPFLERHLVLVDSVHDGLPLWLYHPDGRRDVDRTALAGGSSRSEPMEQQLEVDPPGYLGIAGEPLRGPVERTLLVGPSVLPALGQEGRALAALGAARLVTRSDKRRARIRREMWTKIEIT